VRRGEEWGGEEKRGEVLDCQCVFEVAEHLQKKM
jgi:hypothetical protein